MNMQSETQRGDDDRFTAAVSQLLDVTKMHLIIGQVAEAFVMQGKKSISDKSAGADPEALKATLAAFEAEFRKETPALMAKVTELYQEAYTLEDVEAILAFYGSTAGQKFLSGGAMIEQKLQPVAQAWASEAGKVAFERATAQVNGAV